VRPSYSLVLIIEKVCLCSWSACFSGHPVGP
jgi:hypothetical protein